MLGVSIYLFVHVGDPRLGDTLFRHAAISFPPRNKEEGVNSPPGIGNSGFFRWPEDSTTAAPHPHRGGTAPATAPENTTWPQQKTYTTRTLR